MAKALVIVESPAKAKTINKYLGRDYTVIASMGHVRDLPKSKLGVDVDEGFAPVYETLPTRKKVLAELRAAGGELLADAVLFDVYTGESVPAGTKSLAFALVYQAPDRTLTDKEIEKAHQKVEGRLRHVLKAQIRGKDAK